MQKRGLSSVITTLIIILLVMVAVGIVWVVIRNVIEEGSDEVSLSNFMIDLTIQKVVVGSGKIDVTVKRNAGRGQISGLRFVIDDGETSVTRDASTSLQELESNIFTLTYSGNIEKISVAPLLETSSGKETLGRVSDEYEVGEESAFIEWTRYPGNPVFSAEPLNSWENLLVTAPVMLMNVDGSVYHDSNGYWMYYTGGAYDLDLSGNPTVISLDQMGLARSQDLLNWQRVQNTPVLTISSTPSYDHGDVQVGTVLYDDNSGIFMAWYSSNQYNYVESQFNLPPGDYVTISYATSNDGINWNKYSGNPIFIQGIGDDLQDMYIPIVLKEGNLWKMWYTGHNSLGELGVMYATANNPEGPWTRQNSGNYVFSPETKKLVFSMSVFNYEGLYYMYYINWAMPIEIELAISEDGINWEDQGHIFRVGDSGEWDQDIVYHPSQIYVNDQWYTFYSGVVDPVSWSIGVATSQERIPSVQ